MSILQLRVKDTSTVLFDFENPTGAGNPSSLKSRIMSLDPGGNTKETGWFSPSNRDGDTLVYSRNGRRTISLSLLLQGSASDFDSLRAGVESLVALLEDGTGKDIYWVADSDVRRIDFQTADISRVLDGSHEGSVHALTSGKIIGFPVTIHCDPFERGPVQTLLSAQVFGVDVGATVHVRTFTPSPDSKTKYPVNFTISPVQAGSKVTEILMATRTRANVADLLTTGQCQLEATGGGWTLALSNNTALASDTDAIPGTTNNIAQVDGTSANVGVMLRRVRATRTTPLDSLRGWCRVIARVKMTGVGSWKGKLGWGPSLADPVANFNESFTHTVAAGTTAFGYVEKDLGYIRIPEDGALGGIALEIHAQRISGTGNLNLDLLRLLPATPGEDVLTRIVVPGGVSESWLGKELVTPPYKLSGDPTWTAGTVSGTVLVLDTLNEAGGTPPNIGLAWPVGRHRLTYKFQVRLGNSANSVTAKWRVVSVGGGGAGSEVTSASQVFSGANTVTMYEKSLEFDSAASTSYQPQLAITAMGADPHAVDAFPISHTFIPALAQNEQAHTEPESGIVHKRDSSGNLVSNLSTEGEVPFYVSPGLTAIFIIPLDAPKPGYTEGESVKGRTVTLTAAGAPRFTG